MKDKIKSIFTRELTLKETALAAVFFIALITIFLSLNSESETIETRSEIVESEKIPKPSNKNFEIVRAESKLPKFDPFSKDHLTRDKISELKSQPKIEEKSEIKNEIVEEKSSIEDSKIDEKIVEDQVENPIEDQIEESIPESKQIPPIKLKGIIFADEKSIAIVEFNGEHDLMLGDSIGDWKIVEINRESIVLDSGDRISIATEGDINF